ncbi:hypothetical protein N7499_005130 [Penicillium canescens]|uniref:uncharacterized protein n=1 Tax=Penicillium canescens TaxID=5083 RepID=UPI0026DFCF09|nr:uncharacterized protein N7446_004372 [Penicillium canescens]KAJ6040311.1 hypothetical protein N7444_009216 [Penicillium canescens]KAJ6067335.1 hypothetical protein N7446_004372 [Penicillium canescens]KAJ6085501.1 hypothetical protein N7499_005130 [Penicillium canescens]KAJ6162278.1 hypothetical protein N7485_010508 [Penicillium canescens]
MRLALLSTVFSGATSAATHIYAASYAGTVTTLSSQSKNGSYSLSKVAQSNDCGISPSWLMLNSEHNLMLCLNEGIGAANGSLTSFRTNSNGSLTTLDVLETLTGPVMSSVYTIPSNPQQRFVAVAHYEASAVTAYTWNSSTGHLARTQTFTYQMPASGPVPDRQDASHPHGAIVDPTGRFVLVPDLGMDRIHIFEISPSDGRLQPQAPLLVKPGSGPRHAVFWTPSSKAVSIHDTVMYLVSELDNTLSAFKIRYTRNGLGFTKVFEESTYGEEAAPDGSKASGIQITPGNDHIVVSNRGDATFGKQIDSFAVFKCARFHGSNATNVSFVGLFPAYGPFPREFDFNGNNGNIAVALQNSHEVALIEGNAQTGGPGKLLSKKTLDGEIPIAIWGP